MVTIEKSWVSIGTAWIFIEVWVSIGTAWISIGEVIEVSIGAA